MLKFLWYVLQWIPFRGKNNSKFCPHIDILLPLRSLYEHFPQASHHFMWEFPSPHVILVFIFKKNANMCYTKLVGQFDD